TEANRYFYPVAAANNRSCNGITGGNPVQRLWSGNFLNWAAMQAVDTFRMALTGGYRVHRPADGTPPTVTIVGSNGSTVTKSTSEMPNVTYLEKGNSDRFENRYTPLRRLSGSNLVKGATPAQTNGLRTRIGGLRNQLWFALATDRGLGRSHEYNNPHALSLPVTNGNQPAPDDNSVTAIPYNPQAHSLDSNNAVYAVSIRVKVCDGVYDTRAMCTAYGSNYKPEGLRQANAKKTRYSLFSYLAQSGLQRNGGVMRALQKLIGPVTAAELAGTEKPYPDRTGRIAGIDNPEWDPNTGVIIDDPDTSDSSSTSARIGTCTGNGAAPDGSGCRVRYSGVINYLNRFGQIHTGMATLKAYDNLSEMYYTALRYMRGVGNIAGYSALYSSATTNYQYADGLPVIEDWYGTGANAAVIRWTESGTVGSNADPILYRCQANVFLGIGDTATNNEDANHSGNGDIENNFVSTWLGYTEGDSTSRNYTAALAYWAHVRDIRP